MKPRFAILFLVAFAFGFVANAEEATSPDLVVVISIDQMRADYIERFAPWFSEDGFERLKNEGAWFTGAAHRHSITQTGPGHATIGTGLDPHDHGIVSNYWYDRDELHELYCVEDASVSNTGKSNDGSSPRSLAGRGLGDALKQSTRKSKVIGVSLKDRSAILMAGRKADAAYWFDDKAVAFESSDYYDYNDRVLAFNGKVGKIIESVDEWKLSGYIPTDELDEVTHDPPHLRQFKRDRYGLGTSFPHPVANILAFMTTPHFDTMTVDLAMHIVEVEELGTADGSPDILFLGLSSLDWYGHYYGPDSMEVADGIVRLDRDIARLLTFLDEKFKGRWTVALTADHGVHTIPEVAVDLGRNAGRLSFSNPRSSAKTMGDLTPDRLALEKAVATRLGYEVDEEGPVSDTIITYAQTSGFYIDWIRADALGLEPEAVRQALKKSIASWKGVARAFTASELLARTPPADELEVRVRRAFRADRGPDVVFLLEPGYIYTSATAGTTHGQPDDEDMRVPVLLAGVGVKHGEWSECVSPADMTRTIGHILGLDVGAKDTVVLPCVETE